MHHAQDGLVLLLLGHAGAGVAVAGTGAPHHHAADGVVVLLHHLLLVVQQVIITKGEEACKGQTKVGCLQKLLDFPTVGIKFGRVQLDVWWQHSVDNLGGK